jgi:hypothetical protein
MLYRVVAHRDHTVTVTWSDGVTAIVDLAPVIAIGNVFSQMQDPDYFVGSMRIAADRPGLEWPNHGDFSAGGLRFRAFPEEAEAEFGATDVNTDAEATNIHHAP